MLVDASVVSPPLELVAELVSVVELPLPSLVASVASVVDPVDVAVIVVGDVIVVTAELVAEASVVSSPPEQAPQSTTAPIANAPPHPC